MTVSLERGSRRLHPLILLVGLVGAGVAAYAYLTSPPRVPSPETEPAATDDPRIHVPLFVDPAMVKPTPRFRFTFDPPNALTDLRQEEHLDEVVAGAADDLDRCVKLMSWTRAQWEPGRPDPYPPLNARVILKDIRRGFTGGFCAQYNYVLAQGLQSLGIPARYVTLIDHEVIEARLPDTSWWVCLDPLYDTYYTDASGRPLSVYEIHRRVLDGQPVILSQTRLVSDTQTQLDRFRSFAVWLKNDHITAPLNFADIDRYKVYFLDAPSEPASRGIPPGSLTTTEPVDLYPG